MVKPEKFDHLHLLYHFTVLLKAKTRFTKYFFNKKKPKQKEIYGKQFKTYRNHLMMLLIITKDKYYKTHFKEKKKRKLYEKILKRL